MDRRQILSFLAIIAAAGPSFGAGESFKPAVAFDVGGRNDHSFNESALDGVTKFSRESGVSVLMADAPSTDRRAEILRSLAGQGATFIVAIGFSFAEAVGTVAKEFPKIEFTLIDAEVAGPNIQSVTMREQEAAFLVGMLAAMASKTGKIGFIGGMDVPLIRKFAAGYKLGALRANKDIAVLEEFVGNDVSAWNNPVRAGELATGEFNAGADVVFAAAGASGIGAYEVAHKLGKLAIGVDVNQNGLFPGTMLTSMVKRVDVAVYRSLKSAKDDTWIPGLMNLGLANGAVGWALDDNNRTLVTPEMEQRVQRVAQEIVAGRIRVSDNFGR